ncbi:MAG: type IV pilin protein [Pseudomonadota bacterium]
MRHSKGFTLIELMIVVAVVGILSAIAFGYYTENVLAANRTEARSTLSEVGGSLEKCRSLYGSYNHANCNVTFPVATESNYYNITASAIAATTFTLTATPVAGGAQSNDADCTTLTLTNAGVRGATGANTADCW